MAKESVYKEVAYVGSFDGDTALSIISRLQILVNQYGPATTLEEVQDGLYYAYYYHEETDIEYALRLKKDYNLKLQLEANDREMLALLKAKYGE